MIDFSELDMANAFEIALRKKLIKGVPEFDVLYREVTCQQGIPDFIGLPSEENIINCDFSLLSSVESSSMILSFLKYHSGRKKAYIREKTGLSDGTLNKTLKELIANNFIVESDNLYYLSPSVAPENNNIWAFELKLSNWKRALFQSLQNKAFANYSIAVFPMEKEKILHQNIAVFTNLNVGVLLFDFSSGNSKWLRQPKKERALSKWQTLFLLGKVSSQKSQETRILITSKESIEKI